MKLVITSADSPVPGQRLANTWHTARKLARSTTRDHEELEVIVYAVALSIPLCASTSLRLDGRTGIVAGLGAGRLHKSDPAYPVVGMLELAGVSKSGLDEQRDDAVAEVAGHSRACCHPAAYQAGQVTEGVGRTAAMGGVMSILAVGCRAAEVHNSDLASRPQGPERVARERDPAIVVDVMQRQRRDHVVE